MKLSVKKRLQLTRYLLLISIIGSVASIYTSTHGMGEIYPFFYWKLYTQPIGWDGKTEVLRIYAKKDADPGYNRIPLKDYPAFSKDDISYAFGYAQGLMHTDSLKAIQIFKAVTRHVEPFYDSYRIVSEYYDPSVYFNPGFSHHDSIIAEFY